MDDEEKEHRNYGSGGGIFGLIILAVIGWWVYTNYLQPSNKPWWNGTAVQNVCVVHNPNNRGCGDIPVTVEDGRITRLDFSDGTSAVISANDCGKVDFDGGMAAKGKRYCVIGAFGGGREWQVNEK